MKTIVDIVIVAIVAVLLVVSLFGEPISAALKKRNQGKRTHSGS